MRKKDRNSFACKLNTFLWERDMTMSDLADTIGTAKSTVFYWVKENRPPRLDVFGLVADALQLTDEETLELVNTFRNKN